MKQWLSNLMLSLFAVFLPIKAALITTFVLVCADFILGVSCAIKNKEAVTSRKMRTSVSKILAYEAAIALTFLAETYLIGNTIPVTKIVSGLIGASELKSVLENADCLSGGSLFKTIINRLSGSSSSDQ